MKSTDGRITSNNSNIDIQRKWMSSERAKQNKTISESDLVKRRNIFTKDV